jgi:hypothetical protein
MVDDFVIKGVGSEKSDEQQKKDLNGTKDKCSKHYLKKFEELSGGRFSDANALEEYVQELKRLIGEEICNINEDLVTD